MIQLLTFSVTLNTVLFALQVTDWKNGDVWCAPFVVFFLLSILLWGLTIAEAINEK